jgi:hypothetical protein
MAKEAQHRLTKGWKQLLVEESQWTQMAEALRA